MAEKIHLKLEEREPKPMPKNLYQRISAVMSELDYIEKGALKVNGQYRFVSHDQVTAKVHPLLVKHGIVVLPSIHEIKQENNRTEVKMNILFLNIDNPEECFSVQYFGYGIDNGDKGPGKAISYAYKYALLKTFCLETGDDPDNDANAAYEPVKCLDFDLTITPHTKELKKLEKFLQECAESTNKHVEDVKREAVSRPEQFLEAFKKWSKK